MNIHEELIHYHINDHMYAVAHYVRSEYVRIGEIALGIFDSFRSGGKLMIFGNGGSAADAQHLAAELINIPLVGKNFPTPAIALTTDSSVITSISNDDSFEKIFGKQIHHLGDSKDVALAISTSGKSPNIIFGLKLANAMGIYTVALTGLSPNPATLEAKLSISINTEDTQIVQECHLLIEHIIYKLILDKVGSFSEEVQG